MLFWYTNVLVLLTDSFKDSRFWLHLGLQSSELPFIILMPSNGWSLNFIKGTVVVSSIVISLNETIATIPSLACIDLCDTLIASLCKARFVYECLVLDIDICVWVQQWVLSRQLVLAEIA